MIPSTKKLREALGEFGDRGELLDAAYNELYRLEKYVRERDVMRDKDWCFCEDGNMRELYEIAIGRGMEVHCQETADIMNEPPDNDVVGVAYFMKDLNAICLSQTDLDHEDVPAIDYDDFKRHLMTSVK